MAQSARWSHRIDTRCIAGTRKPPERLRQPLDCSAIHDARGLVDTPPGDHPVARDLRQRNEHERALEQARVGQREVGLVQRHIVIGDDVDIGRARPVSLFMRAIPPELQFDLLGAFEKLARRERRFHRNGEVDEMRLVLEAPWRRPIVGRARGQPHVLAVAEQGDGTVENGPAVSDISAEGQQRFNHGGFAPA